MDDAVLPDYGLNQGRRSCSIKDAVSGGNSVPARIVMFLLRKLFRARQVAADQAGGRVKLFALTRRQLTS